MVEVETTVAILRRLHMLLGATVGVACHTLKVSSHWSKDVKLAKIINFKVKVKYI